MKNSDLFLSFYNEIEMVLTKQTGLSKEKYFSYKLEEPSRFSPIFRRFKDDLKSIF